MVTPSPLVSIVMAAYGRPDYLLDAVASVRAQTMSDWELIVVDDCSPIDPTPLLEALDDDRIRVVRQPSNVGIATNVATGMRMARGLHLTNVHDDDLIDPTYVERLLAALDAEPGCVLAFCDHRVIDPNGRVDANATEDRSRDEGRAALAPGPHQPFDRLALVESTVFLGLGTMWRAGVVDWDDVATSGDHWDQFTLYLLAQSGGGACFVPARLGSWRRHEGSNTMASSGHGGSQVVKIRTGRSRVYCYTRYRSDPRLTAFATEFTREIASGHASVAIGLLRTGDLPGARRAAMSSIRTVPNARAAATLGACFLPRRLQRRFVGLHH